MTTFASVAQDWLALKKEKLAPSYFMRNTNIDFYHDMSTELSQTKAIAGLLIVAPQHVGEEIDKDTLGVSAYALRHKIRGVIKILDV